MTEPTQATEIKPKIALNQLMPDLSNKAYAYLGWLADEMVYGEAMPYYTASFFSLLKAMQAVGTNIYGLQETLKKYHETDKNLVLALNI